MVGKHLEGDGGEERLEAFKGAWQLDVFIGEGLDAGVAFGDDGDDAASACLDFLNVAHELVVEHVLRGDDHHGHLVVDEGDGAVLHFGSGVSFGMDIADFLELQRTFEGYGIVVTATQVKEVVGVGEDAADVADMVVGFQHFRHLFRNAVQLLHQFIVFVCADDALLLCQSEGQHGEDGDLAGECLGRSYTNLRAYVDV